VVSITLHQNNYSHIIMHWRELLRYNVDFGTCCIKIYKKLLHWLFGGLWFILASPTQRYSCLGQTNNVRGKNRFEDENRLNWLHDKFTICLYTLFICWLIWHFSLNYQLQLNKILMASNISVGACKNIAGVSSQQRQFCSLRKVVFPFSGFLDLQTNIPHSYSN